MLATNEAETDGEGGDSLIHMFRAHQIRFQLTNDDTDSEKLIFETDEDTDGNSIESNSTLFVKMCPFVNILICKFWLLKE